jgi:hypothetical protein
MITKRSLTRLTNKQEDIVWHTANPQVHAKSLKEYMGTIGLAKQDISEPLLAIELGIEDALGLRPRIRLKLND